MSPALTYGDDHSTVTLQAVTFRASYYTSNAYIYYSSYNYLPLLQDYKNNTIHQFFYIHEYHQIHEFTSTVVGN